MIIEKVDLLSLTLAFVVTRICDECGKQEKASVATILNGRKCREKAIDLCSLCANRYRTIPTGKNHKCWKHGLTNNGYRRINHNGKRELEHRVIIEAKLGRKLTDDETIHHIDMNKLNNNIKNLYVCQGMPGHAKVHASLQQCGYELVKSGKIFFDDETGKYVLDYKKRVKPIILSDSKMADMKQTRFYLIKTRGKFFEMCSFNCKIEGKWKTRSKKKHVWIAEAFFGRRLFHNECVHHIDGDDLNNGLDNLVIINRSQHHATHKLLEKLVAESFFGTFITFNKNVGQYVLSANVGGE